MIGSVLNLRLAVGAFNKVSAAIRRCRYSDYDDLAEAGFKTRIIG